MPASLTPQSLKPLAHLIPHHIGVATQSIESELPIFKALGFEIEGEFVDQTQGIRGVFITSKATHQGHSNYRLELLENLPQSTRLDNYLKNHHKLYHIAFVSRDIQSDSQAILDARFTQNTNFTRGGGKKMSSFQKLECLCQSFRQATFQSSVLLCFPIVF